MSDAARDSPDPSSHRPADFDAELDDLDDDDMDFEPSADNGEDDEEDSEDIEYFEIDEDDEIDAADLEDDEEEEDAEFEDAPDGSGAGVQIELEMESENGQPTNIRMSRAGGGPIHISRDQLLRILGNPRFREILQRADVETEDDDDEDSYGGYGYMTGRQRRRRPRGTSNVELPPVPNPKGRELMESGIFGSSIPYRERKYLQKKRFARRLVMRELGFDPLDTNRENRLLSQQLIPESEADMIIHYDTRCYSGQFSDDGNFFFTCSQDFNVRMYDTSNPHDWKYYKQVHYPFGQWTITDASLSRDNKFLAFSSIRPMVCLAATDPESSTSPYHLDFSDMTGTGRPGRRGHTSRHFGIWSIRFSGDGREIVAGTSEQAVYVYDIEANRSILRIQGHEDDVNAVCFGDKSSPHILYSGSDDSLIKVWDRRSMGDSREAGVFVGHTEGLTYVDSKGDGRYVLSNGKDQTMKLWDLRSMTSTEKASQINPQTYMSGFDYRFMSFSDDDYVAHPHDCSVVTFRGHRVLKTLIRCHFSPPNSSDSRYVYTGSESGSVYIYNMDATLKGVIDVNATTRHTRPRDPSLYQASVDMDDRHGMDAWKTCVRDASWHPNAPMIAATSWNGYGMSTGTCTVHSWNDGLNDDESGLETGRRFNATLDSQEGFVVPGSRRRSARAGGGLLSRLVQRGDEDEDNQW